MRCRSFETAIKEHKGLTLAIGTIGPYGHLTHNRQDTPLIQRTCMDECGAYLGFGTILESCDLLLLFSGIEDGIAVQNCLGEEQSSNASTLRQARVHRHLSFVIDREAAASLPALGMPSSQFGKFFNI